MYKLITALFVTISLLPAAYSSDTESPLQTPFSPRSFQNSMPLRDLIDLNENCSTIRNMTKAALIEMAAKAVLKDDPEDLAWFLRVTNNTSAAKTAEDQERWQELSKKVGQFVFPEDPALTEETLRDSKKHQTVSATELPVIFTSIFMQIVTQVQQESAKKEAENRRASFLMGQDSDDSE